jgi:hypothetical protein
MVSGLQSCHENPRAAEPLPAAAAVPQSARGGGLSWSPWHNFDKARCEHLIPSTSGLYRFRSWGQPGLLYIGESVGRWARLDDLARAPPPLGRLYLNWCANGLAKRPHRGHYPAPYFHSARTPDTPSKSPGLLASTPTRAIAGRLRNG